MALLNENATIPFIARYRKEKTGSLDEVQIAAIAEEYHRCLEIDDRKATILKTIEEQGKLTDELRTRIEQCWDATELEDIYLPYKPHRKTRADVAREQGYEPLAEAIFSQKWQIAALKDRFAGSLKIATLEDRIARRLLRLKMYLNGIDTASRELFGRVEADIGCRETQCRANGITMFHHPRNTISISQKTINLVYLRCL